MVNKPAMIFSSTNNLPVPAFPVMWKGWKELRLFDTSIDVTASIFLLFF